MQETNVLRFKPFFGALTAQENVKEVTSPYLVFDSHSHEEDI